MVNVCILYRNIAMRCSCWCVLHSSVWYTVIFWYVLHSSVSLSIQSVTDAAATQERCSCELIIMVLVVCIWTLYTPQTTCLFTHRGSDKVPKLHNSLNN